MIDPDDVLIRKARNCKRLYILTIIGILFVLVTADIWRQL